MSGITPRPNVMPPRPPSRHGLPVVKPTSPPTEALNNLKTLVDRLGPYLSPVDAVKPLAEDPPNFPQLKDSVSRYIQINTDFRAPNYNEILYICDLLNGDRANKLEQSRETFLKGIVNEFPSLIPKIEKKLDPERTNQIITLHHAVVVRVTQLRNKAMNDFLKDLSPPYADKIQEMVNSGFDADPYCLADILNSGNIGKPSEPIHATASIRIARFLVSEIKAYMEVQSWVEGPDPNLNIADALTKKMGFVGYLGLVKTNDFDSPVTKQNQAKVMILLFAPREKISRIYSELKSQITQPLPEFVERILVSKYERRV